MGCGEQASNLQSWLTSYDPVADGLYSHPDQAQFAATSMQQAREARLKTWLGQGTVRTLRAGTWFGISQSTLDSINPDEENKEFFVSAVRAMGINNLPKYRVSCDHIPRRSWALFRARDVMRGVIESFKAEQAA